MDPVIKQKLVIMGLITTLVIFGFGVAAGAMMRPLLIIPLLGAVLLVLHIQSKFGDWKSRFAQSPGAAIVRLIGTYASQCVLAGVTYLIGYGAARLFGNPGVLQPFGPIDWYLAAGLLVIGGIVSAIIMRLTRQITGDLQDMLADLKTDIDVLQTSIGDTRDKYDD